jgi:energy-coupling factor transporter ATP-binding protein EcfA2
MSPPTSTPTTNPFCTRRIRPGALAFQFPAGETAASLIKRLSANGWRGAIIGPHGSGKTTLLETLIPEIEQQSGRMILRISLHDGQRSLPNNWRTQPDAHGPHAPQSPPALNENCLIIIDGYEQLSRWSRLRLRWLCWRSGAGLLVTAHGPVGFPLLFHTQPTVELAQLIVGGLLANYDPNQVRLNSSDITGAFVKHAGNLRETLFALYDLVEATAGGE